MKITFNLPFDLTTIFPCLVKKIIKSGNYENFMIVILLANFISGLSVPMMWKIIQFVLYFFISK